MTLEEPLNKKREGILRKGTGLVISASLVPWLRTSSATSMWRRIWRPHD